MAAAFATETMASLDVIAQLWSLRLRISLKTCLHFYSQFALPNQARLNLRDSRLGGTQGCVACMHGVGAQDEELARCSTKTKQADRSQPVGVEIWTVRYYNRFLPDFLAAAQRAFIASAIRLRAAEDITRRFLGAPVDVTEVAATLLVVPGGRPRRLPDPTEPPLTPSNA
jgi:hypothetical protein